MPKVLLNNNFCRKNKKFRISQNKRMKVFVCCLFLFLIFTLCGCGSEIASAIITRDDEMTGGSLSFVYESVSRSIYIGGEGEFIQYYEKDLNKNLEAGNRIGLKIQAPNEVEDLGKTVLEIGGVTFTDMFVEIDGQEQNFFNIYPLVTKETKEIPFKITWQDNTQTYTLKIVDGTKLLSSDGEVVDFI